MKIAVVGAETLLGRDLAEILPERLGKTELQSFAANAEGNIGEEDGEAVYVQPLTTESLQGCKAILLAGTADGATKAHELAGNIPIVDCTGTLEGNSAARIVSPLINPDARIQSHITVLAHPAAASLALALLRLERAAHIVRSVVQILAPASEHGRRGIAELHQQTTGLLSFRNMEKNVYDAQLSFNVLPKLGEEAPHQLAPIEQRIERHVTMLLKNAVAMPSLRLIQAPVFHGYSISIWVEFEHPVPEKDIEQALASAQIDVREATHEPPTNAEVAGQSGIVAGDVRTDRHNPNAAWIWVTSDNVRILADSCADLLAAIGR